MEMLPENIVKGLSEAEVQTRLGQCGYNEVREQPPDQVRAILKRLLGPIPWMLEIALVLEVVLGKTTEPVRAQTMTDRPFTSFWVHRWSLHHSPNLLLSSPRSSRSWRRPAP